MKIFLGEKPLGKALLKKVRNKRAPRNRTLTLTDDDRARLKNKIITIPPRTKPGNHTGGLTQGNYRELVGKFPQECVDLLFLYPPYNLNKSFRSVKFAGRSVDEYTEWLSGMITALKPLLKPTATIYIRSDWLISQSIFAAAPQTHKYP